MKKLIVFFIFCLVFQCSLEAYAKSLKQEIWNFDSDVTGMLPDNFSNQLTGSGNLPAWEVISDSSAPSQPNVLEQTSSQNSGNHFNLAVIENTDYRNLILEAKFKAVSGKEDQGGGLVWRYSDPNNYYIARINPLENNFRVYKVINGNRIQLQSAGVGVKTGEWHDIKIVDVGKKIQCFLDDKLYLQVSDNTFRKGKIGFWTKADSVTAFDDIKVDKVMR